MSKDQYTLESWMIAKGKRGNSFYSDKEARHLTAIATHHKRKIKTERLITITSGRELKTGRITKVILL